MASKLPLSFIWVRITFWRDKSLQEKPMISKWQLETFAMVGVRLEMTLTACVEHTVSQSVRWWW